MEQDFETAALLAGVSKGLGGKPVLDRLNLSISAGEVTALLGPNGAGKSTTVGLLVGRLQPDAGEARLYGLKPDRPAALRYAVGRAGAAGAIRARDLRTARPPGP